MRYQLIFNVIRYECAYRPGHEAIYHNLVSGLTAAEGEFIWHEQEVPDDED